MKERRHYSKAPITEAVIDLRATQGPKVTIDQLSGLHELIAEDFPVKESLYAFSGQFSFRAEDPGASESETKHAHLGFRFVSKDKRRILLARLDGFTFSNLAPYDRWETFRDEALRLWEIYVSNTQILNITRAAVRYINRLEFRDTNNVKLSDYFRTYPESSDDWPHSSLNGFFLQMQIWQEDLGCLLILNESAELALPITIQLDIDLFKERLSDPWLITSQAEVWEFLEQLHDRKNRIFEGSITDKTREMIL